MSRLPQQLTPEDVLALREKGAVRVDLYPDGVLARIEFAPLPEPGPPGRHAQLAALEEKHR